MRVFAGKIGYVVKVESPSWVFLTPICWAKRSLPSPQVYELIHGRKIEGTSAMVATYKLESCPTGSCVGATAIHSLFDASEKIGDSLYSVIL
jgi:hypothetical protein